MSMVTRINFTMPTDEHYDYAPLFAYDFLPKNKLIT